MYSYIITLRFGQLRLAALTGIFVGEGLTAKHGILAEGGGEAFEKASRVDCVVRETSGLFQALSRPETLGLWRMDWKGQPELRSARKRAITAYITDADTVRDIGDQDLTHTSCNPGHHRTLSKVPPAQQYRSCVRPGGD